MIKTEMMIMMTIICIMSVEASERVGAAVAVKPSYR